MRRIALAGVVAVLALSGCGNTPTGTIIEKEYEARKSSVTTTCSGTGAKRSCKPTTKTKPECWELEIKDSAGEEHEICVSEREWKKWNVGDRYVSGSR